MFRALAWLCIAAFVLSGCTGSSVGGAKLARGQAAYQAIPAAAGNQGVSSYRIGALDVIDVTVFQEPDLSLKSVAVDAGGSIALPLIGSVIAVGKTTSELSAEIAGKLEERYLEDPQVSVVVASSVSQKVAVQGEVTEPGVYEIKGHSTLLEALSMAKGETKVAALKEVVVFRTIDGQRTGALFDVASIRRGEADDPEILGNDLVVVGYSNIKGTWRDILATAPLLNVFRPLGY